MTYISNIRKDNESTCHDSKGPRSTVEMFPTIEKPFSLKHVTFDSPHYRPKSFCTVNFLKIPGFNYRNSEYLFLKT